MKEKWVCSAQQAGCPAVVRTPATSGLVAQGTAMAAGTFWRQWLQSEAWIPSKGETPEATSLKHFILQARKQKPGRSGGQLTAQPLPRQCISSPTLEVTAPNIPAVRRNYI